MCFWSPWQPAGSGFFPFLIGPNFGSDDRRGPYVFFSFSPGGFWWIFWLRKPQLRLALIPMCFWPPWQPAGSGFFPFLIGPNFGSDDRRGPYVFFSFSPGGFSGSESRSCAWL